jgi:cytochrome c oxidase subunit 2
MDVLKSKGEQVYGANCAACHQANGMGIPGTFKALNKSATVNGPIDDHIKTVLNGRPGTAMAAFGKQLSDADIAAVVTYERNSWDNKMGDMAQPAQVAALKGGASATEAAAPAAP